MGSSEARPHAEVADRPHVEASQVEQRDGGYFYEGRPVTREYGKMGKSLKNALDPIDLCAEYGADIDDLLPFNFAKSTAA